MEGQSVKKEPQRKKFESLNQLSLMFIFAMFGVLTRIGVDQSVKVLEERENYRKNVSESS